MAVLGVSVRVLKERPHCPGMNPTSSTEFVPLEGFSAGDQGVTTPSLGTTASYANDVGKKKVQVFFFFFLRQENKVGDVDTTLDGLRAQQTLAVQPVETRQQVEAADGAQHPLQFQPLGRFAAGAGRRRRRRRRAAGRRLVRRRPVGVAVRQRTCIPQASPE